MFAGFVDSVAREVTAAIERQDWDHLCAILHPYLHWTLRDGQTLRGRRNVLAYLSHATAGLPASMELRDGQVYRWVEDGAEASSAR